MIRNLTYIDIEYNEKDLDYIDYVCEKIESKCQEIVDFFEIKELRKKVKIKLFGDLGEFRKFYVETYDEEPEGWVCGFAYEKNVYTLSLVEYQKTDGHDEADIDDLANLILHEFTHAVHAMRNENTSVKWLSEGAATYLSGQHLNVVPFNATLEELLVHGSSYIYYRMMFKFVVETYGKEYVLKLIDDDELAHSETPRLYEEAKEYYSKEEKQVIANTCEALYKECLSEIPQYDNGELVWVLNGSTLCNFLYNVTKIDGEKVSDEFTNACYKFIRQPKGDIDICYREDRKYKFDFDAPAIKRFQSISKEQRTYNFVDHNSVLIEDDLAELCTMETKNGLKFVAKRPEYLFLYKLLELLSVYHDDILRGDIESISKESPNILNDVKNLYNISVSYCGYDETMKTVDKLLDISAFAHDMYNDNRILYEAILKKLFDLINADQDELTNADKTLN